jgi:soluble lytic murein transglycosylase-like protein
MVLRNRLHRVSVAIAVMAAGLLAQPDQPQAESKRQMLGTTWMAAADARRARVHRTKAGQRRNGKTLAARTNIVTVDLVRPGIDWEPTGAIAPPVAPIASDTFSYTTIVVRYASDYGVPATLVDAVIRVESNYKPRARGNAGEIGLMQIKLRTARMVGYAGSADALFDPETNIKFGTRYLAMAYGLAGGDTCGTILRYNAGHGATRMNSRSAAFCSKVKRMQAERDEFVAWLLAALKGAVLGLVTSVGL